MIRSLWTAASGMKSQQTNVDTISNNLANASTTGYKKETTEVIRLHLQNLNLCYIRHYKMKQLLQMVE